MFSLLLFSSLWDLFLLLSRSLRNWFPPCFSFLTYYMQLFSHLSFSHFLFLRLRYLYLCPCELSTSSFFFIPLCTHRLLPPSASIPQPPCLCIYTCLFPFIPLLLHLPRTSLRPPFLLPGAYFFALLYLCNRIKTPSVSPSLNFFWWLCCNFPVIISLICLIPCLSPLLFSPRLFFISFSRGDISMQSHGAVALPSLIETAAKYRHSGGSASFPGRRRDGYTQV